MSLWDMLKPDLQDYIISIRDAENDKDKPKIGYYKANTSNRMVDYYFNIRQINKKSFKADYFIIDYKNTNKSTICNIRLKIPFDLIIPLIDTPIFNIKTTLNDKPVNAYFKNHKLEMVNIRNLKPIDSLDFRIMRAVCEKHIYMVRRDSFVNSNPDLPPEMITDIMRFFYA